MRLIFVAGQVEGKTDFGISSQAVGKWLRKGKIPHGRILPLCRILEWQVTPHEIDPVAYPNPTDGLPKQES